MRIDVEYNKVPQRALTFWEKYQIAEILTQYPALTLKVLMRRKVGLRRCEPLPVFIMAGILIVLGLSMFPLFRSQASAGDETGYPPGYPYPTSRRSRSFLPQPSGGTSSLLLLFGVAVAACGYWQHWHRWKELRAGDVWHTYSEGVSPIEDYIMPRVPSSKTQLPNPPDYFSREWWMKDRRIYRKLDPLLAYAVALIFYFAGDKPLALWIAFAAACLAANENLIWRHQIRHYLDWHDGQIDAAVMRGWSGKRGRRAVQPARSVSATYGLPTGIGEDIRARVEAQAELLRRQAQEQQRAERTEAAATETILNAPDNLAA